MSNYWVGKLPDGNLVLYDSNLQAENIEDVRLFVYYRNCLDDFPRVHTHEIVRTVKDPIVLSRVNQSYLEWQETERNKVNLVKVHGEIQENENSVKNELVDSSNRNRSCDEPPHITTYSFDPTEEEPQSGNDEVEDGVSKVKDRRFEDLEIETWKDMTRRGSLRFPPYSGDYDYSIDDPDSLESDDYLDDYNFDNEDYLVNGS